MTVWDEAARLENLRDPFMTGEVCRPICRYLAALRSLLAARGGNGYRHI